MKVKLRESIKDYRFWTVAVCAVLVAVLIAFDFKYFTIPTPTNVSAASCAFIYVATALPFIILCVVAGIKLKKSKTLLIACGLFAVSYILRILVADFVSHDYVNFLSHWVEAYRNLSIKDSLATQVGNYPPLYNYFLIVFSRINLFDMYLLKTFSFYGEVITAVFAIKLVAYVRKEKFNFVLLGLLLLMPIFLMDSSQWGQCDTFYTMCAVAGVYFALRSKSIPCFIFMGLGLAFKMQILVIYPAGLILMLAKKPEGGKYLLWRYIWIIPMVFLLISCLPPMCAGGSFFKVFKVYFEQATEGNGNGLNLHCANLLLYLSTIRRGSIAYYILLVLFILITAVAEAFIIAHTLKSSKRILDKEKIIFTCLLISFVSVFFMPKMLDRFFYIAEIFGAVYFFIKRDKISFTASVLLET
ncbi:MAG: hypothetical protein K2K28_01285, partial [Clostridia bacterium]|nr:hypothetical protein [Clostridia bacterium]